jgi:hypothetical protein
MKVREHCDTPWSSAYLHIFKSPDFKTTLIPAWTLGAIGRGHNSNESTLVAQHLGVRIAFWVERELLRSWLRNTESVGNYSLILVL